MPQTNNVSAATGIGRSEDFWIKQFEGVDAAAFPRAPASSKKPSKNTASAAVQLPSPSQKYPRKSVSEAAKILLVASWALVLGRYLDVTDVTFGCFHPQSLENVVPQRIQIPDSASMAAYLRIVEEQIILVEQQVPSSISEIAKLSEWTSQACQAIQNVLVINDNTGYESEVFSEHFWNSTGALAQYPLLLVCDVTQETCMTSLRTFFDPRVVASEQADRITAHIEHVWKQLLALSSSTEQTKDVVLLNERDENDIMRWNQDIPESIDDCVHNLIDRRMAQHPEAEAVCAWDGSLTFRQLDHLSGRLACYLRDLSVSCEDFVPLVFEKSKWHVVAMIAVLRAGAAFVPLDPSNPSERLRDIVAQLQPKVILTSPTAKERTGELGSAQKLLLSANAEDWLPMEEWTSQTVKPSNAMYVVFTSGSTGKPKGVVIEHGMFCSKANPRCEVLGRNENTRILQFASSSFDLSIEDVLLTIMYGGCVCVSSEEDRVNDLEGVMQRMRVTCAHITPSIANTLYPENLPSLQQLRLGGEPMTRQHVRRWARMLELKNAYGPTECTVTAAVSERLSLNSDPADLGRAVACRSWIVDASDHNRLCAIGCVGELLLEGPILARGYYNEPGKTADSFIFDPAWCLQAPFLEHGNQNRRFYKTGDLVVYLPDGRLKYIGRKDSQDKLRGQRLELGEIETHLRNCNLEVDDLAVEVIRPSADPADACLVTFCALGDYFAKGEETALGISATVRNKLAEIATSAKDRLAASLPSYAVPSVFLPLKSLPRTISGKTDRKALRHLGSSLGSHGLSIFS
ncbi:uncharacterized protein RHO25_009154 [Cercospora beticola]|nr:hypothetical protein RHO25_009154 [Cercospora beticola]